ncbi:PIN domain-containing protein [Sorangium sp. So ce124]|uniref:PIN domain-containing protein n=1 Tax=Sorangium sp. So ce124 TaxID=3133280 RepID=UPI003F5FAAF8
MKKLFPGSYPPTQTEFEAIWSEGMFVFDTNMLLNFYRYTEATRKEFLELVSSPEVAQRIWIPHRVAFEYHRLLHSVRYEQLAACLEMQSDIKKWAKSIRSGDHHRRGEQFLELANKLVEDAESQYMHPDRQALIERIAELFDGKVGLAWDEKRLTETVKDGEQRYKNKIPPGFEDRKPGDEKYGDLVIWFQIVDEARKRQKPVIFVTDEVKEDWWLRIGGRTVGPLPALRNEMFEKANVMFYMYSGDRFLEQARTSLKRPVADATVAEVKHVREEQNRKQLSVDDVRDIHNILVAGHADEVERLNKQRSYLRRWREASPYTLLWKTRRDSALEELMDASIHGTSRANPALLHWANRFSAIQTDTDEPELERLRNWVDKLSAASLDPLDPVLVELIRRLGELGAAHRSSDDLTSQEITEEAGSSAPAEQPEPPSSGKKPE